MIIINFNYYTMIKNILNLGRTLDKSEQKDIKGGMLSQINCHEIYDECNACNDHNFNECMATFGCNDGAIEVSKK